MGGIRDAPEIVKNVILSRSVFEFSSAAAEKNSRYSPACPPCVNFEENSSNGINWNWQV